MRKFFNILCTSGALMSCCVYGMQSTIHFEKSELPDANYIFPLEEHSQFEYWSPMQIEDYINTNPDVLKELTLKDIYIALTSVIWCPIEWHSDNKVLVRILDGVLDEKQISSALSKYNYHDAFAFFSLAMVCKCFLDMPPKENPDLDFDDGDESIIRDHILNTYLNDEAPVQKMQRFFDDIIYRYGGWYSHSIRGEVHNRIISIFKNATSAICDKTELQADRMKAISELLLCLDLKNNPEDVDKLPEEQKNSLLEKLDEFNNFLEKHDCYNISYAETDLNKIKEILSVNQDIGVDNFIWFNLFDDEDFLMILNLKVSEIISIGSELRNNIYWAYNYRPKGIYEFVRRVGAGPFSGTGTIIQFENMPENMKGRVVLTAAHMYFNPECALFDLLQKEEDLPKKKQYLWDYSSGMPFDYKTLNGEETIVERPQDRSNKDDPTNQRKNVTYSVTFDDQPISKVYIPLDFFRDIAIFILSDPIRGADGSVLEGVTVSNDAFSKAVHRPRNLFTIGYGGWTSMDRIEFLQKKSTMPFSPKEIPYSLIFDAPYDYERHMPPVSGGDSGSAIFYNDGRTISVVGEVPGDVMPYINKHWYQWIQAVAQDASQNP